MSNLIPAMYITHDGKYVNGPLTDELVATIEGKDSPAYGIYKCYRHALNELEAYANTLTTVLNTTYGRNEPLPYPVSFDK